ncbi:MAG: hypothetical protein FWH36_02635, partial [Lentimicrobiaceae bacterium]|nr:hypothetical protein [Lentimicrobiaceae bacterium]
MKNKFENLFSKMRSVLKKGTVETLCMVLVPLMVLLAMIGCVKPETEQDGGENSSTLQQPSAITPILVAKGNIGGWNPFIEFPQQNLVIKTATEWNNLLNNIWEEIKGAVIAYDFVDTNIDFSKYQVISVIDKSRCPYWTVDVIEVTEYADKMVVAYTNLDTMSNAVAVYHQPY